jgi:hypothetical protein
MASSWSTPIPSRLPPTPCTNRSRQSRSSRSARSSTRTFTGITGKVTKCMRRRFRIWRSSRLNARGRT